MCHDFHVPVLSVPVPPETKIQLDALSILMQVPTGRVIEIVASAYVQALPEPEARAIRDLKDAAFTRLCLDAPATGTGKPAPVAAYKFSRLCFKRDVIEALGSNESFRVETPIGSFQMSRADFYRVFPNVAQSSSYVEGGMYHYRKLPRQAEEFRVG